MKKINYIGIVILIIVFYSSYVRYKSEMNSKAENVTTLVKVNDSVFLDEAKDIQQSNSSIKNEVNKHDSITVYNLLGEASGTLFSDETSGLWSPGMSVKKTAYIYSGESADFSIDEIMLTNFRIHNAEGKEMSKNTREYNDFIDNMQISITKNDETQYLGNCTIREVLEKGNSLNHQIDILRGSYNKLNFIVFMNEKAGNSLQGLQCKFDITYTYSLKSIDISNSSEILLPDTGPIMDEIITAFMGIMFIFLGKIVISRKK